MDRPQEAVWTARSAEPKSGYAGIVTFLSVVTIAFLLSPLLLLGAPPPVTPFAVLATCVACFVWAAGSGFLLVMVVRSRRGYVREVVHVRIRRSEIVVSRVDGSTTTYPATALTTIVHESDFEYPEISRFGILKLTFGEVREESGIGGPEDEKTFAEAVAALNVPTRHGYYADPATSA